MSCQHKTKFSKLLMFLSCCLFPPLLRFDTYSQETQKMCFISLDHHHLLLGFPMGEGRLLMLLALIFAKKNLQTKQNPKMLALIWLAIERRIMACEKIM